VKSAGCQVSAARNLMFYPTILLKKTVYPDMKYIMIFFIVLVFFGCEKVYTCRKEMLVPVLKGYSPAESDTLIIKRFQKGSNFSSFIDSIILRFPTAMTTVSDTTYHFIFAQIDDQYDVKLTNPYDKKTVAISEIKFELREGKTSGCGDPIKCISPIISYIRDGVTVSGNPIDQNETLLITK
jgi:hypothetical protein